MMIHIPGNLGFNVPVSRGTVPAPAAGGPPTIVGGTGGVPQSENVDRAKDAAMHGPMVPVTTGTSGTTGAGAGQHKNPLTQKGGNYK